MSAFPHGFRPTLAHKVEDFSDLRYPVMASAKIDGIRCVFWQEALSRTLRPIRNNHVQQVLSRAAHLMDGLDGELVSGSTFHATSSAIMSEAGEPDFTYWVFDVWMPGKSFLSRTVELGKRLDVINRIYPDLPIKQLPQAMIENPLELTGYETQCLMAGYEGVMVRDPRGGYKFGRSTALEGILGKIKRFFDSEAEVVGFEALERNENEATRNALGLTERSSDASGKRAVELLGKLKVASPHYAETFGIGSGFTALQREHLWKQRETLLGKIVKFKYLSHGTKDKPRHPIFLGFRDREDCDWRPSVEAKAAARSDAGEDSGSQSDTPPTPSGEDGEGMDPC